MNSTRKEATSGVVQEAALFTAEHIAPFAAEFERRGGIPDTLIRQLAERGYLAAPLPKEYGGLGLSQLDYGRLTEQVGKGCASVRSLLTVHTSLVAETLFKWGSKEQRDKWLPDLASGRKIACFALTEPEVGSDAKNIRTTCRRVNNGYMVSGRKKWITMSGIADLFLVAANGEKGMSTFLIEKNRTIKVTPMSGLLAGRASHIGLVEFDKVYVPQENLLGREGEGFTYIVNTALDNGRYSIAWSGLALAQASLESMVSYARTREQFGKKIYSFQLVLGLIADAVTKVHVARAACEKAGMLRDEKTPAALIETTIAKYFTSKIAMEIASDAVQVHGGNGCCDHYPAERYFREAKVLEIIEGTSQIQQEIIGHFGLRKYPGSRSQVRGSGTADNRNAGLIQ